MGAWDRRVPGASGGGWRLDLGGVSRFEEERHGRFLAGGL